MDNRHDPGPSRAPGGGERPGPPPDVDECFLDRILGRMNITQHGKSQGIRRFSVSVIESAQGVLIPHV
jgi:hypothetical protein